MATLFFISAMTFLFLLRTSFLVHGLYKTGGSEAGGSPWSSIEHNGKMDYEIRTNSSHRKNYNRFV